VRPAAAGLTIEISGWFLAVLVFLGRIRPVGASLYWGGYYSLLFYNL